VVAALADEGAAVTLQVREEIAPLPAPSRIPIFSMRRCLPRSASGESAASFAERRQEAPPRRRQRAFLRVDAGHLGHVAHGPLAVALEHGGDAREHEIRLRPGRAAVHLPLGAFGTWLSR